MLSEEEKKAIDELIMLKYFLETEEKYEGQEKEVNAIKTVLNLINRQNKIFKKIEEYAKGTKDVELLLLLKGNIIEDLINKCKKAGLLDE